VPGWTLAHKGSAGGTVWRGHIPNAYVDDTRLSAVYVPPGYNPLQRYPVLYLLHGLPGSPASYFSGLDIADLADAAIAQTGRPFIIVMPVGGPATDPEKGEWAGVWSRYVTDDVVPWTDAHLPTLADARDRALGGLCAGGYGAMNIGLRHPRLFSTLEAFEGYFAPVFRDGPFAKASRATLAANDPTLLVRDHAALLRSLGVRFYVSAAGNHGIVHGRWTLEFSALLARLDLRHELWLLPHAERTSFWKATLPSALAYAAQGFAAS
jgi:enterochelin esterase-like enzyme